MIRLAVDQIKAALTGISDSSTSAEEIWGGGGHTGEQHITNPNSQLVYLVIQEFVPAKLAGPFEKMLWGAKLSYGGRNFFLAVRKMTGFSIGCDGPKEGAPEACAKFLGKLRAACAVLARDWAAIARESYEKGRFSLYNPYLRTWPLYQFHRERFDAARVFDPETKKGLDFSEFLKEAYKAQFEADRYGVPALIFFFSYLDAFLEASLAFAEPRPMTLKEFRQLEWSDQFQALFPTASNAKLQEIYEELLWCRRNIRNVAVHGYAQEESIMAPVPGHGLMPLDARDFNSSVRFGWHALNSERAERVAAAMDAMLAWIEANDWPWMVSLYLRTEAPIPFDEGTLAKWRPKMASREDWEGAMDALANKVNDHINFDF